MKQIDAQAVVGAVGGARNIDELEPCIARVRIVVKEPARVQREKLRNLGVLGVVLHSNIVQIVVGPEADILADEVQKIIDESHTA